MKKCSCPVGSPFHWKDNKEPTVFYKDPKFRNSDKSFESTKRVEQARASGELVGYMYGISKKREEELLRIRNFRIYSK